MAHFSVLLSGVFLFQLTHTLALLPMAILPQIFDSHCALVGSFIKCSLVLLDLSAALCKWFLLIHTCLCGKCSWLQICQGQWTSAQLHTNVPSDSHLSCFQMLVDAHLSQSSFECTPLNECHFNCSWNQIIWSEIPHDIVESTRGFHFVFELILFHWSCVQMATIFCV